MSNILDTNLTDVAIQYINYLQIPITDATLTQQLEENPYYPNLYSLCSAFRQFNINNDLYSGTEEDLKDFNTPYLARLYNENVINYYVLVTEMSEDEVRYFDGSKKIIKISKKDFFQYWQNVIFVAEKGTESGEKNYLKERKKENQKKRKKALLRSTASLILTLTCLLLFLPRAEYLFNTSVTSISLLLIIKLAGVFISVLLLIYEIDNTNSFVKNICAAGKKTNCDKVLNSKASKFLGMGWNEIGFFYFSSSLLLLLLPGIAISSKIFFIAIANALASPYILFSIYYQWRIVKQWCILCLITQAILFSELVWSLINFWIREKNPIANLPIVSDFIIVIICILLPFVIWYWIKPVLIKSKNSHRFSTAYKRLKYNPEVFNTLLNQQQPAPEGLQNLGINLGNTEASTTVIFVSNPSCTACTEAHSILKELIKQNENVQLKIIFATSQEAEILVAKYFLSVANDSNKIESVLDEWYLTDLKDRVHLLNRYKKINNLEQYQPIVDNMNKWCEEATVPHFPYFYVNGKTLPDIYSMDELKNIFVHLNKND